MIEIINLTPHAVSLYSQSDCVEVTQGNYKTLVLKEGAEPKCMYPSAGVARASAVKAEVDHLEIGDLVVPVNATTYGAPEGLPEPVEGRYYIVSTLTAQAAVDRKDLLIVDSTVRDGEGRIVGCTAFGRVQSVGGFE